LAGPEFVVISVVRSVVLRNAELAASKEIALLLGQLDPFAGIVSYRSMSLVQKPFIETSSVETGKI